ncbi:efflux RND transporter periplasmic adaptor subunit [Vibrio sp. SCSIO 43135]|nr:efflux RND transporter periplasmic adaptor subunit [Vibrio sp. SCSIO 43135]USD42749.1 efflux RND transporter periplasmic adaptor subunit [Vibrio sp. SCSIO 43135]
MKRNVISKLALAGLAAVTLTSIQGCEQQTEHRPRPELQVNTVTLAQPIVSQYRSFNGQVVPAELTPLSFRLDGEISGILVQEGDRVKKGEVVAILDDSKQKQTLFDAQAKMELALKQFQRGKDLFSNKMISKAEHDELTANFKLAQANLGLAKSQIEYTRLRSPAAGTVAGVDKKRFENTSPGESVLSIYQDDQVYVRISLSDSVIAMLNPNRNAKKYQPSATFSGHEGSYTLNYLEHTSELHPQSQTYEFWLSMPQVEPEILPGTSVNVTVDMVAAGLSTVQGFEVPMTAIDSGLERKEFFVWKLQEGVATRAPVEVEQINSEGAVVASGVQSGDVLINSNLRKLREGMAVQGAQQ